VVGAGDGGAWFHFPDAAAGKVYRYRLGTGEAAELETAVLGANPRVLENCLRAVRPADIILAEQLVPEPEVVSEAG
jgi:hypothetical protein